MRIVITGAAGFIGSVLTQRAKELGHDVIALDNLSRGLNEVHRFGSSFIQHDCQGGFAEALAARTATQQFTVDAVVHLAAGTGSLDRPLEELRVLNVEMTKRVYEDAKRFNARVFAFPTTSLALAVPDSPYVISKEEAFEWVKTQTDVPVLPLRFFNVAGEYKGFSEKRKNEVHIIPRLVRCSKYPEEFVINGSDYDTIDGTPSRDFINVLDVVEIILGQIEVMVSPDGRFPALRQPDGALWIGTGHTLTALQVLRVVQQYLGGVHYKIGPRRAFDTGALHCSTAAVMTVRGLRGGPLVPAWVSIRDEARVLLVS